MNTFNPKEKRQNFILLNESCLNTKILTIHNNLLKSQKSWHKFVVSNTTGYSRNQVLKAVLDKVFPCDLIPVFYTDDPSSSSSHFLARNCKAAIERLFNEGLIVKNPYHSIYENSVFKISIYINFAHTDDLKVDVQKNVAQVLSKRLDHFSKILDLNNFAEDPELTEYCTLAQPKIMYFVLHIAKSLTFEELILSNNNIKMLKPLDVLNGVKIRHIDLSNNELIGFKTIRCLKDFQLKELKLAGNPLSKCEKDMYIHNVKQACPTVEFLDGVPINGEHFVITRRNSFCNYDGVDLVNQFLEYFFTLYDTDRSKLVGLYHCDAMFSSTCVYLAGQLSSATTSLKEYSNISRNLLKSADFEKTSQYLFQGRVKIMDTFCSKLPQTEHDPYTFTADLTYFTDDCAIIIVTGVFREKATSLLGKDRLLGFTRSFALKRSGLKCVITNDQLHVYNALTYQEINSFTLTTEQNKMAAQIDTILKPKTDTDHDDLIVTLSYLTNLKDDWARKCLEERSFNLKAALELFVDLFKSDKLPNHAFVES
ncbi:hypothetical protein ABEB36_005680 [Hypothenemus hampei]|uniref:Nuclear RNA export factor 2 n=1 Tax=Hypothenemus hampei TaxID=57062 RepID=A0ABD1EZ27_HYPHA